jgi:hypothetical protein
MPLTHEWNFSSSRNLTYTYLAVELKGELPWEDMIPGAVPRRTAPICITDRPVTSTSLSVPPSLWRLSTLEEHHLKFVTADIVETL